MHLAFVLFAPFVVETFARMEDMATAIHSAPRMRMLQLYFGSISTFMGGTHTLYSSV